MLTEFVTSKKCMEKNTEKSVYIYIYINGGEV
nr:MAG TPA: hypothetical protein [Caudoviricetes sp.]